MAIDIIVAGSSRSFPTGTEQFVEYGSSCNAVLVIGENSYTAYAALTVLQSNGFCGIELGTECLSQHVGLDDVERHRKTVGFARFRLGDAEPSNLIELVRQPWTSHDAVAAARALFERGGFTVAVCEDFPGRIVDRLIRPYFNAILRRFDEGLASADDLDATLRLGLGYPEGPLALLNRTGLANHYDVTQALYVALGDTDFAPARRAQVAKLRAAGRSLV
jgi:3-hydroxybutyryl-CoA dehydrogenase